MSKYVLKKCRLYVAEFDLSLKWNSGTLNSLQPAGETTLFHADSRAYIPGMKNHNLDFTGLIDTASTYNPEDDLYGEYGIADVLVTVCPTDGTDGEIAYSFKSIESALNPIGGSVGDPAGFNVTAQGDDTLIRGTIIKNCTAASITGNGTGTAYQLGAVTSTQKVYACLHVYALDGGTLSMIIQSDDAEGFPSSVTRITFTGATDLTSEWKELAGPITDTWWRAGWFYDGTACKAILTMMIL